MDKHGLFRQEDPDAMTSVSAIIDREIRYADSDSQLRELLRAVFDAPHVGWAVRLLARDDGQSPFQGRHLAGDDHRLRVVTDLKTGWGALNFLRHNSGANRWDGWNTFNPNAPVTAPELPFGLGRFTFPRDAALPLDIAREAAEEYCHTGQRPTCVQWKESSYF
jgi:hypothetical protein